MSQVISNAFRYPLIYFVLYVICLYSYGPSWPNASIKYLPTYLPTYVWPGRVAQSVGHLTHKSGVLGSIPGLGTYFRFSFRFFKKGSRQLLAKVCARSTG